MQRNQGQLLTLIGLLLAALLASGCQQARQQRTNNELLELENLQLEMQLDDALYQLKQAQMCCAAASADDRKNDDDDDEQPTAANVDAPDVELGNPGPPPTFDSQGQPSLPELPDFAPPNADVGPLRETEREVRDRQVADIQINGAITGGIDKDERPGDEGIEVGVELLNSEGQLLAVPGRVAVELWDHTTPQPRHVARWDLDANEASARFRAIGSEPTMYLALDWPHTRPKANDLKVYVRYTAPDGRRFKTEGPVSVLLTGRRPQRWSPAPKQWEERVKALVPVRPATHRATSNSQPVRTAGLNSILQNGQHPNSARVPEARVPDARAPREIVPPRDARPVASSNLPKPGEAREGISQATANLIRTLEAAVGESSSEPQAESPSPLRRPSASATQATYDTESNSDFSGMFAPVGSAGPAAGASQPLPSAGTNRNWNAEAQRQMEATQPEPAEPERARPKWSPFRDE